MRNGNTVFVAFCLHERDLDRREPLLLLVELAVDVHAPSSSGHVDTTQVAVSGGFQRMVIWPLRLQDFLVPESSFVIAKRPWGDGDITDGAVGWSERGALDSGAVGFAVEMLLVRILGLAPYIADIADSNVVARLTGVVGAGASGEEILAGWRHG